MALWSFGLFGDSFGAVEPDFGEGEDLFKNIGHGTKSGAFGPYALM